MKILKPADAFDKSAKIYQDKFMDVSQFANTFDFFCNNITANSANILDIACGPGNITRYLLNKRSDYKIFGIDLSPKMLELAQANNPAAKFQLMDCRKIGSIKQKFDGIVCGFCLPYLTPEEALKLIASVSELLSPEGIFYLSTMAEDDHNKSRFQTSSTGDRVYVHYHQEGFLTKALGENKFEVINLSRFSSPDKDGLIITDLVLIGKLNLRILV